MRFKNAYELLNLRAIKISMLYKNHIFQCMGKIFCAEFQRVPFEISHKISYPYIERRGFYSQVEIEELLDLRTHKCFWNDQKILSCLWWRVNCEYLSVGSGGACYKSVMTSSNGNIFLVTGHFCEGIPPVKHGFPLPVTQTFDVFVDLLNKRLSKKSRRCWFETPSRCNDVNVSSRCNDVSTWRQMLIISAMNRVKHN